MNKRAASGWEREQYIMQLRLAVEKKAGFPIKTSKDFERLSFMISESDAGGNISSSTLKRIWGYVRDKGVKNLSTLDILARYSGEERGFESFCRSSDIHSESESGYKRERTLNVTALEKGERIKLAWHPGRLVLLRYEGDYTFSVLRSEKSRLKEGMKIKCTQICAHLPLVVSVMDFTGEKAIGVYEAGRINGVEWSKEFQ